jgi:hypothetical protein
MNIQIVTPPPVEPVTMAQVYIHVRLGDSDEAEDAADSVEYPLLVSQIKSAREKAEQITRRAFVQQTLRLIRGPAHQTRERRSWDYVFSGGCADWGEIELPRPPLISVSAVRYYDSDNVLQTIDPVNYFVTAEIVPQLRFINTYAVPFTYLRGDAIQIEYIAGYAPVPASGDTPIDYRANIPDTIKQAILIGVQLQYDDLTPDQRTVLEKARDSLLESHRIHTF